MPFPGGLEGTANATLVFALAAAMLYLVQIDRPPSLRRTGVKVSGILLLAALAFGEGGPMLLVAGLVLSALGDGFLSRDGERAFLGGLVSFLLAHVLYTVLFATAGGGWAVIGADPGPLALAAGMGAYAFGMVVLLWPRVQPDLRAPVAIYAIGILGMGLAAVTLPVRTVLAGALLFMISDGLLALEKFVLPVGSPLRRPVRHLVWISYVAAQVVIVLGVLGAG